MIVGNTFHHVSNCTFFVGFSYIWRKQHQIQAICLEFVSLNHHILQGGPLLAMNGLITPVNGRKKMGFTGVNFHPRRDITPFITGRGPPCKILKTRFPQLAPKKTPPANWRKPTWVCVCVCLCFLEERRVMIAHQKRWEEPKMSEPSNPFEFLFMSCFLWEVPVTQYSLGCCSPCQGCNPHHQELLHFFGGNSLLIIDLHLRLLLGVGAS